MIHAYTIMCECYVNVTDALILLPPFLFLCLGVDVKKNVVVTISSDKGLCGGINSTSVKISRALNKLNAGNFCTFYLHILWWL